MNLDSIDPEVLSQLTESEIETLKQMDEKPFDGRKVFFATPAYRGELSSHYVASIAKATEALRFYGAEVRPVDRRNVANHVRLRNTLVTDAIAWGATDIIFVDSDIGFEPQSVIKLMAYEMYNGEKIELIGACPPLNIPIGGKPFAYKELPGQMFINPVGVTEVAGIPTAFMRITRSGIERMTEAYTTSWYDREGREVYQLFKAEAGDEYAHELMARIRTRLTTIGMKLDQLDPNLGAEVGGILWDTHALDQFMPPMGRGFWSEDYWFCERFRRVGGRVFLATDIPLVHFKTQSLQGSVAGYLRKTFEIERREVDDQDGLLGRPDLGEDIPGGGFVETQGNVPAGGAQDPGAQPHAGQGVPGGTREAPQRRVPQSPFHAAGHPRERLVGRIEVNGGPGEFHGGDGAQPGDSDGSDGGVAEPHPSDRGDPTE